MRASESRFSDSTEVSDLKHLRGLLVGAIEGEKVWGEMSRPHPLYIVRNSMFMFVEHWQLHVGRW